MKRFLLLFLLMLTIASPTWAAKLNLRVFDAQSHPITHAKMLLDGVQEQRTDDKGYVTFEISDDIYANKENPYDYHTYYLTYVCDDVETSYYDEYYYTRNSETIQVYANDENRTIDFCFHDLCIFLNFDFTKHLSEFQRKILKGQVMTYTVSNGGTQETRYLKYNGETTKGIMFFGVDKTCNKVTCQMNSDLTGQVTSTTSWNEEKMEMPATIDVNLFDGMVPLMLNSLTGIDGKPVTEGTVGICNLADGLPAVVRYINPNDYNINLPCLLKGYQGFTYLYTPDNSSFDIDLRGKGKTIDLKLLDHQSKPMRGAEVLTYQSLYSKQDSVLVAETDENGVAHYNRLNSGADHIMPWYLTIKTHKSGYICPPVIPEGEDEGDNKATVIINYSKYHFIDLRVKNGGTQAWNDRYEDMRFSVNPVDGEIVYEDLTTTSFYDGNDLVYRAFVDKEKIEKDITTLRLNYTINSRNYYSVMPFTVELDPLPSQDVNYTINPLEWKDVEIKYNVPDGLKVSPKSNYYVDNVALNYESFEKRHTVVMPTGSHSLRMAFEGSHVEYELGKEQTFSISSTEENPTATYTLRPEDYTGYALTVVDPNGLPAEDYSYAADDLTVRLDEGGKGAIYLANEGEHTFSIYTHDISMKPYAWKETLTKGQRDKTVDLSQMYYKLNVSVKTVASQPTYYNPYLTLAWAESEDALNNAEKNNSYDYEGVGSSYLMSVSSWEHEDESQLYTQTLYLPKGVMKGKVTVGEDECNMPTTTLNGNMDYTFDYSTFGQVTFTFNGNSNKPYNSELKLYSIRDKKMLNTWSYQQGLLLAPGEYKACVIGFKENGDYYYILSPSKTFTIVSGEQTIDMPSAADEDYVQVNLNIKNADESLADITAASVAVTYDGVFNLTEGNNNGAYYFNTRFPWTMLKGNYDYELIFTRGDAFAYAFNTYGHVDITDANSTFDLDMTGKHKFESFLMTDKSGHEINWSEMGIKPYMLEISDKDGNLVCKTSTSYGIILPEGDYNVIVYAANNFGENIQKFDALPLHVDAQSGKTASFILPDATGISSTSSTTEMKARPSKNGLTIECNASDPVFVTLYTAAGANLIQTTVHNGETIDTTVLPKGTYIVRLQQGKQTKTQKFMK